jgi:hypothetical protein
MVAIVTVVGGDVVVVRSPRAGRPPGVGERRPEETLAAVVRVLLDLVPEKVLADC